MLNPKDCSWPMYGPCILKINNIGWCIGVSRKCAASSRWWDAVGLLFLLFLSFLAMTKERTAEV